jgi:hypothetical protein
MRRPGAVCERWHLLTHPAQGMVLLSLSFHPKTTLAQSMVLPPSPRRLQATAAAATQQQQQQQQSRHQRSLSYGSTAADTAANDTTTAATVKTEPLERESDSITVATSDATLADAEQQAVAAGVAAVDGTSASATATTSTAETGAHMFRLRTYRKPVWCAVCSGALLGLYGQVLLLLLLKQLSYSDCYTYTLTSAVSSDQEEHAIDLCSSF